MKIIIWGYPLHSHTHSYIHAAFYKAFKYMNYDFILKRFINRFMGIPRCIYAFGILAPGILAEGIITRHMLTGGADTRYKN